MVRCRFLLILVALAAVVSDASAQIRFFVRSNCDTTADFLYGDVINEVAISGLAASDVVKHSNNIIRGVRGVFDVRPTLLPPLQQSYDTLRVFRAGKLIASKVFEVVKFCDLRPCLTNAKDGFVSVDAVLAAPRVKLCFDGCCFAGRYFRIIMFELSVIRSKVYHGPLLSVTAQMTEEQLDLVRTLRPGDQLIFNNVKGTCSDCSTRVFPQFKVVIR